jgi:hypothetical protein
MSQELHTKYHHLKGYNSQKSQLDATTAKVHYYECGWRWRARCNNSFNNNTPTSTLHVKLFSNSESLPVKTLIIMRNFKACLSLTVVGVASH